MRLLSLFLLFLIAASSFAQGGAAPYPVERGERVRITLTGPAPGGSFYVGSVFAADLDSLSLRLGGRSAPVRALAWPEVGRIERLGENHTGEVLGFLIGGVGGGLIGYAAGNALSEDPLAGVAFLPGAFLGLLIGGVVGAHIGDRWEEVPPVRVTTAFRVVVPLR